MEIANMMTEEEKKEEERLYASEMRAGRTYARTEQDKGDKNTIEYHAISESIRQTIAGRSGFAYNAWQRAYQEEKAQLQSTQEDHFSL